MLAKSLFTFATAAAGLLHSAAAELHTRNESFPVNYGIIAMPGASMLDIYGPLEVLYFVAGNAHISVKIITPDGNNVPVAPPMGNKYNSTFTPEFVGAASFEDDLDLDVLIVPGGAAARDTSLTYVDDYIAKVYPKLDYLITICTGAIFPARAGIFDGRRVTTNKNAWSLVTAHGNNVTWVAPARYVIEDNIWSSSGETAGIDLMMAWVKKWHGEKLYNTIRIGAEIIVREADDDPFTDELGLPHQGQL
ncbi:unnamed protein product [Clonostachys rosea f. rosea IK726]|uniref:Uncharacterized protein n=1 Tax=Clonostachys rosea f. rosea IK726 TaxID=1349383 RepID=A0ACA9T9A0_BIOOC|nr:unnamed protein product [Clonostachys rosea f. rosea IK726]